jgi:hypothetical protein
MKIKYLAITIVVLLMISGALSLSTANAANASPLPSLPSTPVQLSVVNGTSTYFISTLSGVPKGYSVRDGVYAGWCVDTSRIMARNVNHDVILYSSLNPPSDYLATLNWVAINYILNHETGSMMDIQQAIWYFTDQFSPISATAQAMVNAALAHPNFNPAKGAILAIICLPQNLTNTQITIIELFQCCWCCHWYCDQNGNYCCGDHDNCGCGDFHFTQCQFKFYIANWYTGCNFDSLNFCSDHS